jgi:nucleoside 2-deoxyribosyltransferase
MEKKHRIFFAIPFDSATREIYKRLEKRILNLYKKNNVTVITASRQVGPSREQSDIATFKLQNRELQEQFVSQITDADVVIADLTHNNPNVHVELGIALVQNKNILRVTGRSVKELGFDIQNLEVFLYKDANALRRKIEGYLKTFFLIKKQPISPRAGPLYFKAPLVPFEMKGFQRKPRREEVRTHPLALEHFPLVRDGAVRVVFEILDGRRMDDWFGVFFRSDPSPVRDSHFWVGSYLAYARRDGRIEVVSYPGTKLLAKPSGAKPPALNGKHTLVVEFENDQVVVKLDKSLTITAENLSRQRVGRILLAAYCTHVKIHSAEMVCRDTIEWGEE